MANQWVIQELLAEKSDVLEWDTWLIGIVENGYFVEKCRTGNKEMAILLVEVLKWFEMLETGVMGSLENIKKETKKRTVVKKQPTKRRSVAKK